MAHSPKRLPTPTKPNQSATPSPRRSDKAALPSVRVISPGATDLIALATEIEGAPSKPRTIARLSIWQRMLALRGAAKRWRRAAKFADGVAKFGGGSLLTLTAGLMIAGQTGLAVLGTGGLTLLLFVGGTIFSSVFEGRADRWELEEEHFNAVLQETKS